MKFIIAENAVDSKSHRKASDAQNVARLRFLGTSAVAKKKVKHYGDGKRTTQNPNLNRSKKPVLIVCLELSLRNSTPFL